MFIFIFIRAGVFIYYVYKYVCIYVCMLTKTVKLPTIKKHIVIMSTNALTIIIRIILM